MMRNAIRWITVLAVFYCLAILSAAQNSTAFNVPALTSFSGILTGADGKPLTGMVGVTLSLYKDQQGGAPLWLETQNVKADRSGRFTLTLGATTAAGLPADLFVSDEARWLGVQAAGQPEQPRVLLLSVPYALKAGDAQTIGGLPPSAFMLAPQSTIGDPAAGISNGSVPATALPPASSSVTTTGGTANAIPLFTAATNIQDSILTQTGITALNVAGKLNLPAQGVATASAGKFSRPEAFVASSFNSASSAAVAQTFQLQVEPAGNNTASPYGTLNLLYGSGTSPLTETGLKINNKGLITFAAGQTFPGGGGGKGTITGVTAGTGLSGGGTTGVVTLKLDTSKVPELGASNDFTAPQEFQANAGIGVAPSGNGYTPLSVGGATSFGTWLSLANTSGGGHTWNIISAGSGNVEGAGNLGITDLTGKSTIWLEGNTNTASLSATGAVSGASMTASGSAGAAIIDADVQGRNNGANVPGLRFGGPASGEGIASSRVAGENGFGLQLFTEFTPRISILQNGQVAVGITNPTYQLDVWATSNAYDAIGGYGGNAANGSGGNGTSALYGLGGNGDLSSGSSIGGNGVFAEGGIGGGTDGDGGVFFGGNFSTFGDGIFATSGSANSWAGLFQGNLGINGLLVGGGASFKIDHPLDPANKYLSHSAVESPDMLNIYNGNVVTDANGDAVVELPEWFESLNRDFRYQLTVIGQFAQAIVSSEVADHHFAIKTDEPGVKVSWLVTGVRQDAWANAHRIPVEEQKTVRERGRYLHPELYGAPEESGIEWARHPKIMKHQKEMRQKAAAQQGASMVK
jgi:hypothetical protein